MGDVIASRVDTPTSKLVGSAFVDVGNLRQYVDTHIVDCVDIELGAVLVIDANRDIPPPTGAELKFVAAAYPLVHHAGYCPPSSPDRGTTDVVHFGVIPTQVNVGVVRKENRI